MVLEMRGLQLYPWLYHAVPWPHHPLVVAGWRCPPCRMMAQTALATVLLDTVPPRHQWASLHQLCSEARIQGFLTLEGHLPRAEGNPQCGQLSSEVLQFLQFLFSKNRGQAREEKEAKTYGLDSVDSSELNGAWSAMSSTSPCGAPFAC